MFTWSSFLELALIATIFKLVVPHNFLLCNPWKINTIDLYCSKSCLVMAFEEDKRALQSDVRFSHASSEQV